MKCFIVAIMTALLFGAATAGVAPAGQERVIERSRPRITVVRRKEVKTEAPKTEIVKKPVMVKTPGKRKTTVTIERNRSRTLRKLFPLRARKAAK